MKRMTVLISDKPYCEAQVGGMMCGQPVEQWGQQCKYHDPPKVILHLCADTGSDTKPYQDDPDYEVIKVGADIGVENYQPPHNVYGIIANPVCLEFSTARTGGKARDPEAGMFLVNECLRIIKEANPTFWVIENPATGRLKDYLGTPRMTYEPWEYGSPWTKRTALWGNFNLPAKKYTRWEDVPKIAEMYTRPGRGKPGLAFQHRAMVKRIPEFAPFVEAIMVAPSANHHADMEFRSLCSQKFAQAFYEANSPPEALSSQDGLEVPTEPMPKSINRNQE